MDEFLFDEEAHKALKTATFAIQDYINPYRKSDLHLTKLKLILMAVVSSTVQIAEANGDNCTEYLWSEIENMAKEGGLNCVAEKIKEGRVYSISDMAADDVGSGMNYLGQHMATSLYKHIHDLPVPQRKPEMYLRGIEALLGNILNNHFAEFDKHKILDDFCSHLHMALDDKTIEFKAKASNSTAPEKLNKNNPDNKNYRAKVAAIDQRVNKILATGGQEALMLGLRELMDDVWPIIRAGKEVNIDMFCKEYAGFYQLMKMLENLAHGIQSGEIEVPSS
jgi:hypothetical protein